MRQILIYSVILFIFSSIISCEKTPAPTPLSGLKIKIGIITSNTGKNASIGKQGLKGIILAQKLNSTLENGDEVELFIEDDQSNPAAAIEALEKLVTKLNVSAVLLLSGSNLDWAPKMIGTDGMLSRVSVEHESDLALVNGMLATDLYSSDMTLTPYGKKIFSSTNKTNTDITSHLLTGIEGYGFLVNAINQCEAPISRHCIILQYAQVKYLLVLPGK